MQTLNSSEELSAAIARLKLQQREQGNELKAEFRMAYESLKPIKLVLGLMKEISQSPEVKSTLVNTSVSLGAGLLTKKIYQGSSHNPFRRLVGTVLQYTVTNAIHNHPKTVNLIGKGIMGLFSLAMSRRANKSSAAQVKYEKGNGVLAIRDNKN